MPTASNDRPRDGHGQYTRDPSTAERDAQICRMRRDGMTLREIGAHFEMHHTSVIDAINRALRATVEEPAQDIRRLELERLDRLQAAATAVLERQHVTVSHGRIVKDDTGQPIEDDAPVLAAIDRLLRISESRRKLLGLDAPARVSVDAENLGAEILALLDTATGSSDDHGES